MYCSCGVSFPARCSTSCLISRTRVSSDLGSCWLSLFFLSLLPDTVVPEGREQRLDLLVAALMHGEAGRIASIENRRRDDLSHLDNRRDDVPSPVSPLRLIRRRSVPSERASHSLACRIG